MLRSDEYGTIKTDYDRVSRTHFPKSYVPPQGMTFAQSDALFPPPELARCYLPSWRSSAEFSASGRSRPGMRCRPGLRQFGTSCDGDFAASMNESGEIGYMQYFRPARGMAQHGFTRGAGNFAAT